MNPTIQTYRGHYFNFLTPEQSSFDERDIAHALARICRFTGHVIANHYSVAQHSVLVSHIVPREHALAGLLHDAAEAFIGDVAKPLKELLPDYKAIEARVEAAVFARFGLPATLPECVKHADTVMLLTERRDLLLPPEIDCGEWKWAEAFQPCEERITPWPAWQAQQAFMDRFEELTR